MTNSPYEKWLAERREVSPPAALADQIMGQVAELDAACVATGGYGWFSGSERSRQLGGPCARALRWLCRLSF
jgi:hypothetical protein